MSSSRQLAAIMFTDIVGYTALMGKDERRAFEFLQVNREIQQPVIREFNGKFIKELGDGIMASFLTVSDAVMAAKKIQELCHRQNLFQLRIGIHLGEVVFENEDVFGDGVNIASRIQAVSAPGSIYISETVQQNISNKNQVRTRFIKKEKLKNVKDPVKVFEVVTPWSKKIPVLNSSRMPSRKLLFAVIGILALLVAGYFSSDIFKRKKVTVNDIIEKSIAILPFKDISEAKDQAYLGDGLAEEITHSMTMIDGIKVIGTTSSSQFKGQEISAKEIGEKLNVGVVLEGSIQKSGNSLRIFAELINAKDNSSIWSQQFDKEMKDIFAIQDTIARHIVEKLRLTLSAEDNNRLVKKTTSDETYQLFLKGVHTYKEQLFDKSIEYFNQAIAKDSLFAPPYAWMALARTWKILRVRDFDDLNNIREIKYFANTAIRLDPNSAEAYSALALLAWTIEFDFDSSRKNFEKSLQLNPGASLIKNRYGYFLTWMGDFDKSMALAKQAIRLDPADYNGYIIAANDNIYKGKFREAREYINEGKKLFPNQDEFNNVEALLAFQSGDNDLLFKLPLNDKGPRRELLLSFRAIVSYRNGKTADAENIFNQLKQTPPSTGSNLNYRIGMVYLQKGNKDSAFACLRRAFENHENMVKLLKIDPLLDPIRKEQQFKELYHRYGFDRY